MIILKVNQGNLEKIIEKAGRLIKKGKIIICPTDTVYGILSDAQNKQAVEKVFEIKKRSFKKPIPLFVKDIKMARRLAKIDKTQEKFLEEVWPGKVTAILERKRLRIKLYGVDKKTIGLRIPKYKLVNALLGKLNRPFAGTSANISGEKASTKIEKILKQFAGRKNQPDLILDAGCLSENKPSTVVDLTTQPFKILRP